VSTESFFPNICFAPRRTAVTRTARQVDERSDEKGIDFGRIAGADLILSSHSH
jgi:hypothetical protein